ncbi:InlB B-repeat-containing protein [Allochromatium palmeri]|uniref:Bacterial repeat domain-containing protein n=1 Tax=Allochromatium palmeri TaxID=231048 RepID=A0A6N8EK74_9GAMM|nr:3-coathanger stack domain-containing protein [Allochromatium palmeri]MTW23166.1 hypothetical protein [Allochromatium palmeri]
MKKMNFLKTILFICFFFISSSFISSSIAKAAMEFDPYASLEQKDYIVPTVQETEITHGNKIELHFFSEENPDSVYYTAFDGNSYTLMQLSGRHVRVLFPVDWEKIDGLSYEDIGILVNRADDLYEKFVEILQQEPKELKNREGLLSIAFIPSTCGWGCGYVAYKGVEILSDKYVDLIKTELDAGILPGVIIHEMTHNFDFVSPRFNYINDNAHAYTAFMENYVMWYAKIGRHNLSPDLHWRAALYKYWKHPYLQALNNNEDISWKNCVVEEKCKVPSKNIWGGHLLAHANLNPDKIQNIIRSLAEIEIIDFEKNDPQQEEIMLQALKVNLEHPNNCYVDQLRWFGANENILNAEDLPPECKDYDVDFQSNLLGDCDDRNPDTFLGAEEIQNDEVDNDCNGLIDEVLVKEIIKDFSRNELLISLPSKIFGKIENKEDWDGFDLNLTESNDILVRLCSKGFQGWLWFMQKNIWKSAGALHVSEGSCTTEILNLNVADWNILIGLSSNENNRAGDYEIYIQKIMNDDQDMIPQIYTLSINKAGQGTITSSPSGIDCGSTCFTNFESGTIVTLSATPDIGYQFDGWSGACSGTQECTVSMEQNQTVLAQFSATAQPKVYTLNVTKTGLGTVTSSPAGIDCGFDCSESYAEGTTVQLSPLPESGYRFVGWSGVCSGTGQCSVSMNQNQTVTATFEPSGTCPHETTLNLSQQTVHDSQRFSACDTITAGSQFVVAPTGQVIFEAGTRIQLNPGFQVQAGGRFIASIQTQ